MGKERRQHCYALNYFSLEVQEGRLREVCVCVCVKETEKKRGVEWNGLSSIVIQ